VKQSGQNCAYDRVCATDEHLQRIQQLRGPDRFERERQQNQSDIPTSLERAPVREQQHTESTESSSGGNPDRSQNDGSHQKRHRYLEPCGRSRFEHPRGPRENYRPGENVKCTVVEHARDHGVEARQITGAAHDVCPERNRDDQHRPAARFATANAITEVGVRWVCRGWQMHFFGQDRALVSISWTDLCSFFPGSIVFY
jgi:hypothetical protein